jgi:hypothetical protein
MKATSPKKAAYEIPYPEDLLVKKHEYVATLFKERETFNILVVYQDPNNGNIVPRFAIFLEL